MAGRMLLTLAVAVSLSAAYAGYAALTRPLMPLPVFSVSAVAGPVAPPPRPLENVRVATKHLPDQEWARNARYHLKTQQAFIYANAWEPEPQEKRIRFRPFAMIVLNRNAATGEEEAMTVVSESASVKFAGTLELPSPEPGRMVHAMLDGRAQIRGPRGLIIDGRNLTFSEAAQQLWSDYEVRFEYAGNRGSADKLQIDLIPQEGPPGDDRPHIFGMRNVRLSRNVKMDLQLNERGEPLPLKIKCNGSFDFDVIGQSATYTDGVVAFRQTGPTEVDWIECERLQLEFDTRETDRQLRPLPVPGQPDQYQSLSSRLAFRRMVADCGNSRQGEASETLVRLVSVEHQIETRAKEVSYSAATRQIQLAHPDGVTVFQARRPVLECPDITLTLGEGQRLQGALCKGAGWLVHYSSNDGQVAFAADWKTLLSHAIDPETGLDVIELKDSASFRQPAEEAALGGELLKVWLRQTEVAQPSTTGPDNQPRKGTSVLPGTDANSRKVDVVRMEAHEDVVLVSPRLESNCQHLLVWVDPKAEAAEAMAGLQSGGAPGSGKAAGTSGSKTSSAASPMQPVRAEAETIRVQLRGTGAQPTDLADIWADGRVVLQHRRDAEGTVTTMQGDQAHLSNQGGARQIVDLVGQPARVVDGEMRLEAGNMRLDRADNQFNVMGPGTMQLPMNQDMEGRPLGKSSPMVLSWSERMSFDGLLATFRGQATAVLDDRRLSCEKMDVTLTERIRFDQPPEKKSAGVERPRIEVRSMTCRDHVQLKSQTYEENKLTEIQMAEVWELHLDRVSGKMHAQGPGVMRMWRRGDGPRNGLQPQQKAGANRPIELDTAEWQYTRVKFDGQMAGQMKQRFAVFKERVEILHGPVKLPNQELTRDQLPKAGGFMSCDQLQVEQLASPENDRHLIRLAGDGNAWLEGQGFAASADQIVFDEVRESYLLRGKGRNNARVWHDVVPGQTREPSTFQRGEFFPATRNIRIDAAASAGSSQ